MRQLLGVMDTRTPPQIELLPDGSFRRQPSPVVTRIFRWAIVIALVAGALAVAAFALWIALLLIPVAIVAGVIAWLAFRYQLWRVGRRQPW
jgi:4-hydroxybenzoate polyprenyltransferase